MKSDDAKGAAMSGIPHDHAHTHLEKILSKSWMVAVALAALVTTVAWAAPLPADPVSGAELTAESGHMAQAQSGVKLLETVTFSKAKEVGECELSVTLHLCGEDGSDQGVLKRDGKAVEANARVVPSEGKTLRIPLEIDATQLAGKTVVCFVRLTRNGQTIWSREDIKDESQFVRFPKVGASFGGPKEAYELGEDGAALISATIDYRNVETGQGYRISCSLLDAETGEALVGEDHKGLVKEAKVTPKETGGTERVAFEASMAQLSGRRIALRAEMRHDGLVLASQACQGDDSLAIPTISTRVFDEWTGLSSGPSTGVVAITEEIAYEGLTPGVSYVVKGTLGDLDAVKAMSSVKARSPKGAIATIEFTPNEPCGTIEIRHAMDAASIKGRTVTPYDVLSRKDDGKVVATFDGDASDVRFGLSDARSAASGTHTGMACEPAREDAGIRSVVTYENLTPGIEYTVEGTLRAMSESGDDDGAITDGEGETATATTTFVPQSTTGTVELPYGFDASILEGMSVSSSESISVNGTEVARSESAAPVSIPSLAVTISEAGTGRRETAAADSTRVVVTADYGNLPKGPDATVRCTLVDAVSGRAILAADGSEVSASEEADAGGRGTAEFALTVDARALAVRGISAYVTIDIDGSIVATASGAWDPESRLYLPKLTPSLSDAQSGLRMATGASTLMGVVAFEGVAPGRSHVVRGTLVDADTGGAVTDDNGDPIAASANVTPEEGSGEVALELPLHANEIEGRTVALVASMECDGSETAMAGGPRDYACRVRIPRVSAVVRSEDTGDGEVAVGGVVNSAATVTYENVEPGLEYVVGVTVADSEDEGSVAGTGGVRVTPDQESGVVEVPVVLDTRGVSGRGLEAIVDVSTEESLAARYRTEGEGLLVVPSISTRLHVTGSDAKEVDSAGTARLTDTVTYAHLTPGVEYVLEGVLVDVVTDKGGMATPSRDHVADTRVTLVSPAKPVAVQQGDTGAVGDSATVWVTQDGTYHLDVQCASAQGTLARTTLGIAKAAGKVACPTESGASSVTPTQVTTEVQKPAANARKATGGDGLGRATVRFTPDGPSGSVDVPFALNVDGLAGRRIVALETLKRNGHVVVEHADVTDTDQTVSVASESTDSDGEKRDADGTVEDMGQTGADIMPYVVAAIAVLLVAFGALLVADMRKGEGEEADE